MESPWQCIPVPRDALVENCVVVELTVSEKERYDSLGEEGQLATHWGLIRAINESYQRKHPEANIPEMDMGKRT
jgi:hypothetical protein